MKKYFAFLIIFAIIIIGGVIYKNLTPKEKPLFKEKIMAEKTLEGKRIAAVLAFRDFRDIEYFIPRDVLTGAGAEVIPVSTQKGTAIGADGGEVEVKNSVDKLKVEDFDAIIFIGGPGMVKELDNESLHKLAQEGAAQGKVLGAICIAPALLAKAEVLKGKKATVWTSPVDKSAAKILQQNGAEYSQQDVVIDGKIVTASGPGAAKKFGEALIEVLK